jgi:hypothetical protein
MRFISIFELDSGMEGEGWVPRKGEEQRQEATRRRVRFYTILRAFQLEHLPV